MKEKRHSINTRFWDDPFVEELNPSEKLLFLYLLTNPLTNLLGIYEITIKRISFDTGLTKETITKGLERFGMVRKAFFVDNYIVLPNWLKNQSLNANMRIAVVNEFEELPNSLKDKIIGNGSESVSNGYETIRNGLLKYEREREREKEDEIEGEGEEKIDCPAIVEFFNKHNGVMPKVEKLTEDRRKAIRARVKEHGKETVAKVIRDASKSNFLNGRNNKNWIAGFDWIMNPRNFVKILEGNYDNKNKAPQIPKESIFSKKQDEELYKKIKR